MNRIAKLAGLLFLILIGCSDHYVATQPQPPVVVVPVTPGPQYVWVNGGWRWSRRSRGYHWREGYWAPRRSARLWVDGHWVSSRRGWNYVPGHWR